MYRITQWLPASLLALHILLKVVTSQNSILIDLALYNAIWIAAIASVIQAPLSNDPVAIATSALAIGFWGVGSLINSYGDFYSMPESSIFIAQLSYALFYPLLMIAIPRTLSLVGANSIRLNFLIQSSLHSESPQLQLRSFYLVYFLTLLSISAINSLHFSFLFQTYYYSHSPLSPL